MLLFIDIYVYMCTNCFCQGTMASSASTGIYDDVDPMEIASDNEFPRVPFTLPDPILDGEPMEDDVLAVGPHQNEFVIIGHPDGANIIDYIPLYVMPLAVVSFMELPDDEDEVLVIHVDHLDIEISDDISYSDVSDDASSSAIRRAGLRADATDSSFDTIPIATQSPVRTPAPI
ncbi:hypothetical protein Hanom_Chr06g00545531 [Helianthus anomalus]